MKKRNLIITAIAAAMLLTGCGGKTPKETVSLSVWTSEDTYDLVTGQLEAFKEAYADEADFVFNVSVESEDSCGKMVLTNAEAAADIFTYADDQLDMMYEKNILLPITENADSVISSVGGADSGAASAAMRDGKLYAYPLTAGNSYFLYYNASYFSPDDLKTMDSILAVAAAAGKKVTVDYSSGWYIYSFFKGAGLDVYKTGDGKNFCNWNAENTKYTGVDVAEAMLSIATNPGFISCDDSGFTAGVEDGSIIAGVNGAWNADNVKKCWGDDYAAVKLPTYTLAGDQVQMASFAGYKLVSVNSNTQYPEWAMKVAEHLTCRDSQLERFSVTGECPANIEAAASDAVQSAPAVKALSEQSVYGNTQNVAECFWDASGKFGITIASGNESGRDLQELLDETVADITE